MKKPRRDLRPDKRTNQSRSHSSEGAWKTQSVFARAATHGQFSLRLHLMVCALMAGVLLAGCRTPVQEESFSNSFDAQRVAQLSHEAFKVAYDATFWARHDLRFAPFHPTALDYEAVGYLHEITRQVPWIAHKVEKNPANPRVASKLSYDLLAYDAMMLRRWYQPTSFMPSTNAKVAHLQSLLDEIASFYTQTSASAKAGTPANAEPVAALNAAPPHR